MPKYYLIWPQVQNLKNAHFICGYCGSPLASEKGWFANNVNGVGQTAFIYVCHNCSCPTFFDDNGNQTPGVAFGGTVNDISDASVRDIYEEARRATSAGSYTAAVLCCRKLLMHMPVAKGAKPDQNFVTHVDYLAATTMRLPVRKIGSTISARNRTRQTTRL